MRAAILRAFGGPVQIEEVRLDPPRAHEATVRIAAVGLCRSDLHCRAGGFPVYKLPMALGHEAAGIVTRVGPRVTRVRAGSHVVVTWNSSCGACWHCAHREPAYCLDIRRRHGLMHDGTGRLHADGQMVYRAMDAGALAEEQVFHENAIVDIDPTIPLEEAALLGCAVATGVGAVLNTARIRAGARVAVIGCGAVGLSAIQGARIARAEVIVAVDVADQKVECALKLGATHGVLAADAVAAVAEITSGIGVDYAFEAVGTQPTIRAAIDMVRRGGVAVVVGNAPAYEPMSIFPGLFTLTGKGLIGSCFGSTVLDRDVPRLVDWCRRGELRPGALISHRSRLADVEEALGRLEQGAGLRTVIVP